MLPHDIRFRGNLILAVKLFLKKAKSGFHLFPLGSLNHERIVFNEARIPALSPDLQIATKEKKAVLLFLLILKGLLRMTFCI